MWRVSVTLYINGYFRYARPTLVGVLAFKRSSICKSEMEIVMNDNSKKRLSAVHPELAKRIVQLEEVLGKQDPPIQFEVVQGLRTFAEQDALFAKGRTKPGPKVTNARGGQSNHNYGLAVDIAPLKGGKIDWSVKNPAWKIMGLEGRKLGLEWGGDWTTLVDMPHFQLPVTMSVKDCFEIFNGNGIEAVWAEADRRLGLAG